MSSFVNKMLREQGYKLPETVSRKVPDNPSDSLTTRFLRNAGFNGPQQVEKEDTKIDTPEKPPTSLTSKLLADSGFNGLPAGGDRSSKSKNEPAYQSQGTGMRFDV